jgi:acyl-coenzyme A synthetase/AMP-(fatty) acid ligase
MLHYWNRPDEDARVTRGEWFVGGDLAAIDDDGYVWFHGRSDDLMNAFGYRVSPVEVEATISRMPGVADCAVAELQVRDDVSVICAWVVRSDNALTPDDVHSWCETHLAEFKRPREVLFREALPRARNGKLDRRALSTRVQPTL